MSEFWIGDIVRIVSSGKIGKYEGQINGMAKIKVDNKILLVNFNDFELVEEDEINTEDHASSKEKIQSINTIKSFSDVLDLHIEKLNPAMQNQLPEMIINYQIKIAKEYLKEAIKRKRLSITIIHGKGTGVLKMEILHLLDAFPQIYFTKSVNDGGAIEILFNY